VARTSWFDERAEHPVIQEQITKLESFTNAMEDGVVSREELKRQEERVTAAMKQLEPLLSDDVHTYVTSVLVEMSAYNVMRLLHELHSQHARKAFSTE